MTDIQTLKLLDLSPRAVDEYHSCPASKLEELRRMFGDQVRYLEMRANAAATETEVLLSDDQALHYFKQSLLDLENSRAEGLELQRLCERVRGKGKEAESSELLEKFSTSLATNSQQWKLVTDFMSELFEQMMTRMAGKSVS